MKKDIPNHTTIKAIKKIRQNKTSKAENIKDLVLKLNDKVEHVELKSFILSRKNPTFAKHL